MAENKVQFNLHNVHYAVLTSDGPAAYETPVAVPGAVSLSVSQVGETKKFYADGIVWWQGTSNNGYEGDLEIANIPEQMLSDVWGMTKKQTDNVYVENANDEQKAFALLFQIDGDTADKLYCLYNCTASRPGIDAATNEESKDPKAQKISFSAIPLENGDVKACTAADTTEEVRSAWFTSVWQKA